MYLELLLARCTCIVLIKWPVSVHFYDCNKLSQFLFVLLVLRRLRVFLQSPFSASCIEKFDCLGLLLPSIHSPSYAQTYFSLLVDS